MTQPTTRQGRRSQQKSKALLDMADAAARVAGYGPDDVYPTEPVVVVAVLSATGVRVQQVHPGDPTYDSAVKA